MQRLTVIKPKVVSSKKVLLEGMWVAHKSMTLKVVDDRRAYRGANWFAGQSPIKEKVTVTTVECFSRNEKLSVDHIIPFGR